MGCRGAVQGFAHYIFQLAPGCLDFAFYLLNKAISLRTHVASPASNTALCAAHSLVDRAFHSILVHLFTSSHIVAPMDSRTLTKMEHREIQ